MNGHCIQLIDYVGDIGVHGKSMKKLYAIACLFMENERGLRETPSCVSCTSNSI